MSSFEIMSSPSRPARDGSRCSILTLPNFASPSGANTSAAAGNWKAARMVAYYYAGAATELGAVKKYL